MSLVLVTSDRFADHVTPPGHPERVERAEAMQVVASRWSHGGGRILDPRPASDDELVRVHQAAYVQSVVATRGRTAMLDPDTFASPDTEEVARLAAGAVVTAIEHVIAGAADARPDQDSRSPNQAPGRALVMVRPPGHHAEADRAMGFCFYNSIAVGAATARARGLSRVAIVDYDVHHGNGTQWMFYDDPSVLFVSSHQYPFYPGTGGANETGRGQGVGFTVNLPMEAGATDADFDLVYREVAIPVLQQFKPELILVSAGFDAHELDPLAGLRMTTTGYGQITARLLAAADELCEGRIVFVTEGGYDTSALAECCQGVIDLASAESVLRPLDTSGDTRRGHDTIREFRRAHSR
ncbi:MAG TPA: histone deacetylase [Vicinamibacterales bacterium]|nr:histone deacetylase [Vicinamibacterales bacterium]